ncbi:MAG: LysR family transcriptional regulator, partial [Acetobacteraceae bacterium]|nr:LysR family transcriptional regulator [Acetobacteraceae bacterium]
MVNFDDAQLRRLDVNLLLVFEEAMASGKLSAAAKRLGLTQSAISHAIGRLREVFGDELFIRTPRGVRPTPRALALREPLAEALRLIGGAIRPASFDPTRDERVFRVAASDYETAWFAPLLVGDGAGASRFIFRTLIRRDALDALQAGDIDLLLGYAWDKGRACEAVTLYDEDYRVVARQGHPALARPLDIGRYASHGHVLVSPGATLTGVVDEALAKAGVSRRVVAAVPYFLAALATVARTDLLATVPSRVARCHAAGFGLATAVPPVPVRSFPVRMVWSRRLGADPALAWLR